MLYANLFKAEIYTVEKFTLGHVVTHGTADSASVYMYAQLSALCQSASQRNSLVILQLRWQRLPRQGAYNIIASFSRGQHRLSNLVSLLAVSVSCYM